MRAKLPLFSVLFAVAAATALLAQDSAPKQKIVFFSADANCGYKRPDPAPTDIITCGTLATGRGPVNTIRVNNIALAVAFLEEDDFNVVAARIVNTGKEPLLFDADLWGAAHFRKKEDYAAGRKPLIAETSLPTGELIRQMAKGARMTNASDEYNASNELTSETREIRKPDGTRVRRVVIVPNKTAEETAALNSSIREEVTAAEQRKIRRDALIARYVPPGSFVKGLVYFRKVKKAEFILYSIRIDDYTFIFRLPRAKND